MDKEALPQAPNLKFLSFAQHEAKSGTFALCVMQNLPSKSLTDPATIQAIDSILRGFKYEFFGSSVVNVANRNWKQYPVTTKNGNQVISGLVRFTQANDEIFMLSLLRGGPGAAQDEELQAASRTVQFMAPSAMVAATPPGGTPAAPVLNPATQPGAPKPAAAPAAAEEPKMVAVGPWQFPREQVRMVSLGAGALFVLILLLRIISGGKKPEPPPPGPPTRRV